MNVAHAFAAKSIEEILSDLAGGTLKIYSVARPQSPDLPVICSGELAEFTFASPAFTAGEPPVPHFAKNPVPASHVGTPGFARAFTAAGEAVADFSVGPGHRDIKLAEVSCSPGAPVKLVLFQFLPENVWPERPDYYHAHPKPGYSLPATP